MDGSPTSWEPGAQSSKTADTKERKECPVAVRRHKSDFLSKLHIFTAFILNQNYHWTDGFFLKNHPLKEAEKQCKFCFWVRVDKGVAGEVKRAGQGLSDQVSTPKT